MLVGVTDGRSLSVVHPHAIVKFVRYPYNSNEGMVVRIILLTRTTIELPVERLAAPQRGQICQAGDNELPPHIETDVQL